MVCPKCKNDGWDRSIQRTPLVNLGGKERYAQVDIRRYCCLNCGYAFKTEEKVFGPINARIGASDLFNVQRANAD